MPIRRRKSKTVVRRRKVGPCYFCESGKNPDYLSYDELTKFVTERARILGRGRTGVCAKHQKRVAAAIKRARFLGLLPFKPAINS